VNTYKDFGSELAQYIFGAGRYDLISTCFLWFSLPCLASALQVSWQKKQFILFLFLAKRIDCCKKAKISLSVKHRRAINRMEKVSSCENLSTALLSEKNSLFQTSIKTSIFTPQKLIRKTDHLFGWSTGHG